MKPVLIYISLLALYSCGSSIKRHEQRCYADVAVVNDRTDIHLLRPEPNPVLAIFGLDEDKKRPVNFKYIEVTDRILNPIVYLQLPDASSTDKKNVSNESMFREKKILSFFDTIRSLFSNLKYDTATITHSRCFRTIASELSVMASSSSIKRIILVYSNLFENSPVWSLYTVGGKKMMRKNPEAIERIFEETRLLPANLAGITVVFIYQPQTMEDDENYNAMVSVYRSLLEKRNAKVIIQASNTFYGL